MKEFLCFCPVFCKITLEKEFCELISLIMFSFYGWACCVVEFGWEFLTHIITSRYYAFVLIQMSLYLNNLVRTEWSSGSIQWLAYRKVQTFKFFRFQTHFVIFFVPTLKLSVILTDRVKILLSFNENIDKRIIELGIIKWALIIYL